VFDSGANSLQRIQAGGAGSIEFTIADTNDRLYVGLSHNKPDNQYDMTDIDFTAEQNGKKLEVLEFGTIVFSTGNVFAVNDNVKINIDYNGVATYLINDTVQFTSTLTTSFPLQADAGISGLSDILTTPRLHGDWS